MEAAPRLPMIAFELNTSPENPSFASKLKPYITSFYHEDGETYSTEIHALETLRAGAVRPTVDVAGCQTLKKYYCQLHFLKSRFPMEEGQPAAVSFTWKNPYSTMVFNIPEIQFELMAVLYNIGALHSKLGAEDTRTSQEGMKMACTHFQCAAWAFQTAREMYPQMINLILAPEIVHYMQQVCLAQAQECILEKSMLDNRKATIIARIAVQVVSYYKHALQTLQAGGDEGSFGDIVGGRTYKEWVKYLYFKVAYHNCIALLFQGQQAEELQKMGERVAFYQAACEQLEEARKLASHIGERKQELAEALAFTADVVEGKRKAAKNENEFIYHEDVPDRDALQEIEGASLVKGIPFSVNDTEVSGKDIFGRLVPMEAHEASSLYSEKKAQMLRQLGELVEVHDQKLAEFMSSLQLDFLTQMHQATGLTQDLLDRAAEISARPSATKDLVDAMGKLSNSYHEVEAMLNEIQELLKEEEQNEKDYQTEMGKRPPSIIATDLAREAAKYREAHTKASESNQTLHRAMMAHVANLKVLQQPLVKLKDQIPSVELADKNIDEASLRNLENLITKVEEMKNQRAMLWAQLRDAVHKDDITSVIVTKQPEQSMDQIFDQELQKHQHFAKLLEQNTMAQENICKALVDAYAESTTTRRYLQNIINKRNSTITALITSYDSYDDLLGKANKGIEFYGKLETNVSKLLQRIRSACKVQEEEREQMLAKATTKTVEPAVNANVHISSSAPKLKDYLDSMKKDASQYTIPVYPGGVEQTWPPGIRPAPLGSEMNVESALPVSSNEQGRYPSYPSASTYNQAQINNQSSLGYMQSAVGYAQNYAAHSSAYSATQQQYTPQQQYANAAQYPTSTQQYPTSTQNIPQQYLAQQLSQQYPTSTQQVPQPTSVSQQYPTSTQQPSVPQQQPLSSVPQQQTLQAVLQQPIPSVPQQPPPSVQQQPLPAVPQQSTTPQPMLTQQPVLNQTQLAYPYPSQSPLPVQQEKTVDDVLTERMAALLNSKKQVIAPPVSEYALNQFGQFGYNPQTTPTYSGTNYSYPAISQAYTITSSYQSVSGGGVQQGEYSNNTSYPTTVSESSQYSTQYSNPAQYSVPPSTTPQYSVPPSSTPQYSVSQEPYPAAYSGVSSSYTNYIPQNYAAPSVPASGINSMSYSTNMYNGQQNGYPTYQSTDSGTNNQPYVYGSQNQQYYPASTYTYQNTYYQTPAVTTTATATQPTSTVNTATETSSNIDLLSGLDFSVSQAPLIPQQTTSKPSQIEQEPKEQPKAVVTPPVTPSKHSIEQKLAELKKPQTKILEVPKRNLLENPETYKLFTQEVEKYEKFLDTLTVKTLNGPTMLEVKWKEIMDRQDADVQKRSISVARCYPMKNRSPDILPYDYSRVELVTTKDDYINASHVRDITPYTPPFIVTQCPMAAIISDFWTMVWEQQVEIVVCLLSDSKIGDDVYWPRERGQDLTVSNIVVSLQNVITKQYWVERLISIALPELRESRVVLHLQFTAWPGSVFPTTPAPLLSFTKEVISLHQQQRSSIHPIVVHCNSGVGLSGLLCVLIPAILDLMANPTSIPDLTALAAKLSVARKNILRDREHLKFAYQAFLYHLKELQGNQNESKEPKEEMKVRVEVEEKEDPLSSLDPFWASKKGN